MLCVNSKTLLSCLLFLDSFMTLFIWSSNTSVVMTSTSFNRAWKIISGSEPMPFSYIQFLVISKFPFDFPHATIKVLYAPESSLWILMNHCDTIELTVEVSLLSSRVSAITVIKCPQWSSDIQADQRDSFFQLVHLASCHVSSLAHCGAKELIDCISCRNLLLSTESFNSTILASPLLWVEKQWRSWRSATQSHLELMSTYTSILCCFVR